MTSKERLLAAVRGQAHDRVPVTPLFMQWAARFIHKSYRDYYLDGETLADAQLAVAEALNTDHVCCISEPWTEADAYGMSIDYPENGVGIPRSPLLREAGMSRSSSGWTRRTWTARGAAERDREACRGRRDTHPVVGGWKARSPLTATCVVCRMR